MPFSYFDDSVPPPPLRPRGGRMAGMKPKAGPLGLADDAPPPGPMQLSYFPPPITPVAQQAGGGAAPPPPAAPEPSPMGRQAVGDVGAFHKMMEEQLGKLRTPPSPQEEALRTALPPIAVTRGMRTSYAYPQLGLGGAPAPEFNKPLDAAKMAYDREEGDRDRQMALLGDVSKAFGPALGAQSQVEAAKIQAAAQDGPGKFINDLFMNSVAAGMQKHGDPQRAMRDAMADAQAFGPLLQGGKIPLPGGTPPPLPGAQPAPAPAQPDAPPLPPPARIMHSSKIDEFLRNSGAIPQEGPVGGLDVPKLAESLRGNPNMSNYMPDLAAGLGRLGLPPDKIQRAIDENMIRMYNEAEFGGFPPAARGKGEEQYTPGVYGDFQIMPTVEQSNSFEYGPEASVSGFKIVGPDGQGTWYGKSPALRDWFPTLRDSQKQEYRAALPFLAALRKALMERQGGARPLAPQ